MPIGMGVGDMMKTGRRRAGGATIQDVARASGVSAMTVSRVVNGVAQVRPATRDAVMKAIAELNYQPNSAARSLAAGRPTQIGLPYANPSASYLSQFLIGALEGTRQANCHLLLQPCDDTDPALQVEAARHFLGSDIQGVILPPPLSQSEVLHRELRSAGVPWVAIAMDKLVDDAMNVRIDDYAAAMTMTQHLLDLGHRDIAFIRGNPNQTASPERFRGFVDCMAAAGIGVEALAIEQGYFTYRSGMEATERLLARTPRPTAIFASNDDMAAAAVGLAHRIGLRVPEDISIAGFDDSQLATSIWPELTTIRQPIALLARTAVELLVGRLEGPDGASIVERILPFELVVRASSGPPPAGQLQRP
jgi:LacI family transcriptional regulator